MKKIMLCIMTIAFSSPLVHGAQSPQSKEEKVSKHVVNTDSDLLRTLQQTRKKQLLDPHHRGRIFDADMVQHNENKKG